MFIVSVDGVPKFYVRRKKAAKQACHKNNRKGPMTSSQSDHRRWTYHQVGLLPNLDDVTVDPASWDKMTCPSCRTILNTDGKEILPSGKTERILI